MIIVSEYSNQLIICFKPRTRRTTCLKTHREYGADLIDEIKELGHHIVKVPPNEVKSCISKYTSCPYVRFVEEDLYITTEPIDSTVEQTPVTTNNNKSLTNDPSLEKQWGLLSVNAHEAWGLSRANANLARIAILDSGIDQNHEDLRGKVIINRNFSNSSTVNDLYGHGTHVAGIAGAVTNNRIGIAGISFNAAQLMNIKVLGDTGGGSASNVAKGIIYAADQGAHIINLSLGMGTRSETLRNAVHYAHNRGCLLVGSAGNNSSSGENYPAAFSQVISVAATNKDNELARFSNYGSWVDLAAPGQAILSTFFNPSSNEKYRTASGTSQAVPFVSGLAGLIKGTNPRLTNRDIGSIIFQATDRLPELSGKIRYGKINALKAMELARIFSREKMRRHNIPPAWLNY